jgi:hypothetical protein
MTWAVQTVGSIVYTADTSTPFVIPAASGITAGDNLFVFLGPRPISTVNGTWNTPSGWTLVASNTVWNSNSLGSRVYHRVATGSDVCTASASVGLNGAGVMIRTTGGPASGLTAHVFAQQGTLSVQDISTPALVNTVDNTLTFIFAMRNGNQDSAGVTSWPASATTRAVGGSSFGSSELSIMVGTVIQTTAATISAGNIDLVSATALSNEVMLVSFAPASTGSGQLSSNERNRLVR